MTMEPSKKKRKFSIAPKKSRKRQKTYEFKPKQRVAVDALPWKTVDVPDMFNDAEGFYGLEEVQGVQVVKNGDIIEFHAAASSSESAGDDNDDDDEFEGFSDLPMPPQDEPNIEEPSNNTFKKPSQHEGQKNGDTEEPTEEKKGRKTARAKEKAVNSNGIELQEGSFTALTDVGVGDEDADLSEWVPLDLSPRLLSAVAKLKFAKPTAIQSAAIPEILKGHDVIGKASTGSGKTLAFAVPIVEKWLYLRDHQDQNLEPENDRVPVALVLSPTRELAHQLTDHIKALCAGLPDSPYVCSVTGGLAVQKQQRQLAKADIVIGTPGRLWEVLNSSQKLLESFKQVKFLVVDEADRLLTEGHFKEAAQIFSALDRYTTNENDGEVQSLNPRQTLVFSATFNKGLQQKLAGKGRYDLLSETQSMEYLLKKLNFREEKPKFVDVNPVSQMAEGLSEGLVECGAMEKDLYLYALLLHHPRHRTLVFTNSISSVRRLTPMIQNLNLQALPLHSQMPQKARLRSIERFTASDPKKSGKSSILIATDVAARGLDIKGIDLVIHYHVPRTADAYVHRSGRTARAESSGLSILLCAPEEVIPTRRLVAKVHAHAANSNKFYMRTVDLDHRIVGRLKPRVTLAKKIADAGLAKDKGAKEDNWMKTAAEELGVDYDSEELEKAGNWGGRGSGRKKKEAQARSITKAEVGAMRAELRELLSKRVNTGVSERYITGSGVNIEELLREQKGEFLGTVGGLGFEDA